MPRDTVLMGIGGVPLPIERAAVTNAFEFILLVSLLATKQFQDRIADRDRPAVAALPNGHLRSRGGDPAARPRPNPVAATPPFVRIRPRAGSQRRCAWMTPSANRAIASETKLPMHGWPCSRSWPFR